MVMEENMALRLQDKTDFSDYSVLRLFRVNYINMFKYIL